MCGGHKNLATTRIERNDGDGKLSATIAKASGFSGPKLVQPRTETRQAIAETVIKLAPLPAAPKTATLLPPKPLTPVEAPKIEPVLAGKIPQLGSNLERAKELYENTVRQLENDHKMKFTRGKGKRQEEFHFKHKALNRLAAVLGLSKWEQNNNIPAKIERLKAELEKLELNLPRFID